MKSKYSIEGRFTWPEKGTEGSSNKNYKYESLYRHYFIFSSSSTYYASSLS